MQLVVQDRALLAKGQRESRKTKNVGFDMKLSCKKMCNCI